MEKHCLLETRTTVFCFLSLHNMYTAKLRHVAYHKALQWLLTAHKGDNGCMQAASYRAKMYSTSSAEPLRCMTHCSGICSACRQRFHQHGQASIEHSCTQVQAFSLVQTDSRTSYALWLVPRWPCTMVSTNCLQNTDAPTTCASADNSRVYMQPVLPQRPAYCSRAIAGPPEQACAPAGGDFLRQRR